jgi:hypothetical protein
MRLLTTDLVDLAHWSARVRAKSKELPEHDRMGAQAIHIAWNVQRLGLGWASVAMNSEEAILYSYPGVAEGLFLFFG